MGFDAGDCPYCKKRRIMYEVARHGLAVKYRCVACGLYFVKGLPRNTVVYGDALERIDD